MGTFESQKQILRGLQPVGVTGKVSAVRGLTISVSNFPAPIGAACRIVRENSSVEARVIGFAGEQTLLMPLGSTHGICRHDTVEVVATEHRVAVSEKLLGRVIDGFGNPIDGGEPIRAESHDPVWPEPIAALERRRIDEPLATGVRAIDGFLTVGRGQRMSILSGSGVGKSVLLGMIARYTSADVNVVALIGERGREVKEFLERELGPEGLRRSIVVVSTSDEPPLARVQAGAVAATVAEFFRRRGKHVLLLMDSLTRLATAQRQIGLAVGEPPATRGYTPSVFSLLPRLLERCGCVGSGSVTGFYSVLVDGDDMSDPVADATRAVTDGHIWLSRDLAGRGQYPAIDVLQSVSRVMTDVTDDEHIKARQELQKLTAIYRDIEELVHLGAYQRGASAEYDNAIEARDAISAFLEQDISEYWPLQRTRQEMIALCEKVRHEPKVRGTYRGVTGGVAGRS